MKVIANRQLYGSYGTLRSDEECDMRSDIASALLKRGLVREKTYEVKATVPAEAPSATPEVAEPKLAHKARR